jgi:uncharacterized membrane protein YeaQ/YmgE (transglycosylase-associated protein family)
VACGITAGRLWIISRITILKHLKRRKPSRRKEAHVQFSLFLHPVVLIALGSVAGYFFSSRFLFWVVPRRRDFGPSIVAGLTGSFVLGWGGTRLVRLDGPPEYIFLILLGFAGAILALYASVKIGTPGHATVAVVCNAFGVPNDGTANINQDRENRLETWMRGRKIDYLNPPPTVWPETFWVSQEGSVSWMLYGEPGTKVTVRFDKGYDPFRSNGDTPSVFRGTIPTPPPNWVGQLPGLIVAAPVARAGRGGYRIIVELDGVEREIDPGGGSPKRRG